jgi:putative transposase
MGTRARHEVFVHLVWGTLGRAPVITAATEGELHRVIGAKCGELGCTLRAIGGTADHVHLLVQLLPAVSVAELVGAAKGASSHAMNNRLAPGAAFRWQHGYGAFSVSGADLSAVARYVIDQKQHHEAYATDPALEPTDDEA